MKKQVFTKMSLFSAPLLTPFEEKKDRERFAGCQGAGPRALVRDAEQRAGCQDAGPRALVRAALHRAGAPQHDEASLVEEQ